MTSIIFSTTIRGGRKIFPPPYPPIFRKNMTEIQKKIEKTEKELDWIKKTIESLKKREQHKLQLLMNLKIQELKQNVDSQQKEQ